MDSNEILDGFLSELFTNLNYTEHFIELPSKKTIKFKALPSSSTDPDLTGQIIWPGCTMLINYIDQNLNLFQNKKCIEIGAGIAICSLFVNKFSLPSLIIATDGSDIVCDLIKENSNLENCKDLISIELKWGNEESKKIVEKYGQFDIVFGSEIAYNENCIDSLVETINILLSKNGIFVIGHINRFYRVTRYLFEKLENFNFIIDTEIPWDNILNYKMDLIDGSVYIFKRKNI